MTREHVERLEQTRLEAAPWLAAQGRLLDSGRSWLTAAQAGHALERPSSEVRSRLESGARACSSAAAAGDVPADVLVPYTFWRLHSVCRWAGCEGPLRGVPRDRWSNESGSNVPGLREVLDLLLAEDGGADITAELGALKARSWTQPFARRVSQPLAALHHARRVGDAVAFQEALLGVVDGHLYMVRGEMKLDPDAFLILGLLGPLRTAVRNGLPFELDTPYLPHDLVRD